jgi:hypothetical protein
MKGSRILAFPPSQCTDIKPRSCVLYPFNCFSPLHILSCLPLSNNNLNSTSVKSMSSPRETKVPATTVDGSSTKSPSSLEDESDQNAGTGGHFLDEFEIVSHDGAPAEEYPWTFYKCSNRSKWGGGNQEVKTELPAVTNISDSCMTHTAQGNTRNSNSQPEQGRTKRPGVTRRKAQAERETRVHTRSQGPVSSEGDGASTTGGRTAVGIKNDVGQKVIKKEKL